MQAPVQTSTRGWLARVHHSPFPGSQFLLHYPQGVNRESRSHSESGTLLLMIRRRSCGNLFRRTEDNRLPYDSDATPSAFKLLMCDSMSSCRHVRPFRLCAEVTRSMLSNVSMCFVMICCLLPNHFFRMATALW